MEVDPVLRVLIYTFTFFSMLGIGLKVKREDIANNLKDKALMGRSLLANFVIVPLIAYVVLKIFPMQRVDEIALIMLALTPGGLSALQFTTKSKDPETLAYSAILIFVLSILSLILSPLLIMIFVESKYEVKIPYGKFILVMLLFIMLPLLIGLYLGRKKEKLAQKLEFPMALIGTLAFFGIKSK